MIFRLYIKIIKFIILIFFFMTISKFNLKSLYNPSGDQPDAIKKLVSGLSSKNSDQVLLGVTGSGKTFTMANIINKLQRPALIFAPNKILAAQLYGEMKSFFPSNCVEYFVSYYDYYTPEAYVPRTDTYIEKESSINEQIDRMRHSATRSILERRDTIIVASVSCIYGIGSVQSYSSMSFKINKGEEFDLEKIKKRLVELQYKRNDQVHSRGTFRNLGDMLEIFPAHLEDKSWRISFFGNTIESIDEFDPFLGTVSKNLEDVTIYANSHYVTPKPSLQKAVKQIKEELIERIAFFEKEKLLLEAQRIEQRTNFDIEMIVATGSCSGIENYSRYLSGRNEGEPPPTLFEYLPKDTILFIDESHVTIPQIRGMFKGDRSRKETLSEYGFRLPSCKDNRPLMFEEWESFKGQTIYVSATPGEYELKKTKGVIVEQVVRPTGLVDPICEIRKATNQIEDIIEECKRMKIKNLRVLITTLTKKDAEKVAEFLNENDIKAKYMHSDIDALERIELIKNLRMGSFEVLVGINLLREGLDIPECGLVAILDADKEGFLRSHVSLIQTIGRAARNLEGRVILYADQKTDSILKAIEETTRRRIKQINYNKINKIIPKSTYRKIEDILPYVDVKNNKKVNNGTVSIDELKKKMISFAENLEFEKAAEVRDQIQSLEKKQLGINE
ncbi:MAG: excinuclease ABC subunit B [Rickettsiales bacterium]|nr:excinuclease ABC subunit B [Rickettsiales bacterium]